MKLYGTSTSPYVRRVRVVAGLVGAQLELVNTATEAGQNELRTLTPIWKVPVLDANERVIFDSHVICDFLVRRFGNRNLRTDSGEARWREQNLLTVIDGAQDSAVNVYYLRDVDPSSTSYLQKQRDRVESAMNWLDKQLVGIWLSETPRLGLTEIALYSMIDWMRFRGAYDVTRHPMLTKFAAAHAAFEGFATTAPVAAP
ncbi:MAG: glutathione S-transferase family protein [Deltaproteobacteria bacterium]|nr:glutathione S-transferase family protein [Deltaproteobacteria bacterium]